MLRLSLLLWLASASQDLSFDDSPLQGEVARPSGGVAGPAAAATASDPDSALLAQAERLFAAGDVAAARAAYARIPEGSPLGPFARYKLPGVSSTWVTCPRRSPCSSAWPRARPRSPAPPAWTGSRRWLN